MASPSFHRIGLTGGIGSGKTTLGRMLVARGIPLVDADAISHQVTAPQGAGIEPIRQQFGDAFINAQGALDRDRMRQHVFTNPEAKLALQSLLHPLIQQSINQAMDTAAQQGHTMVLLDIPLLVESLRWRGLLDKVIVVDCSEQTQVRRVMARNHMSEADVRQIMANQAKRSERLAAADVVVFNDEDDLAHLQAQALGIMLA
jgi:dephospho-CoA kinase